MIQKPSGFSLIELLIALSIIAILSMAATSYFGKNVKKARCTEGRSALLERSVSLEKCKAIYGAYNNANCNVDTGNTPEGHFDITLDSTATTFKLTATAIGENGPSGTPNPYCTTITIDQLGTQGGTGTAPW